MKPATLKKYMAAPAIQPARAEKVYQGQRLNGHVIVTVDEDLLGERQDLHDHSPTGFEWGYGGSGPSQLALALLADHLGDDQKALELHQEFKFRVVAALPESFWTLTSHDIDKALRRMGAR